MHDALIEKFGGLQGIKDMNFLLSAIETPKATMFDMNLYSTIYNKAAAYLFHIMQNNAFNDANKCTGFDAASRAARNIVDAIAMAFYYMQQKIFIIED